MGLALPFVWKPMSPADLGCVGAYAVVLFGARCVVVEALRVLPAFVAMPLMNLQFVWMVAIGALFFSELPTLGTLLGVMMVVASGIWLVVEETLGKIRDMRRQVTAASATPAE